MPRKATKTTVPKTIFVVINDEDKVVAYCKDMGAVTREIDKEEIYEGKIFEIVKVFNVFLPEEPSPEISEGELKALV